MAKPATKTARKAKAVEPTAVEVAQTAAATTMDPQTGMDVVHADKPAKAAVAKQFAEADRKADPAQEAIDEATLSRSIRGW